jgi:hypothetical protein
MTRTVIARIALAAVFVGAVYVFFKTSHPELWLPMIVFGTVAYIWFRRGIRAVFGMVPWALTVFGNRGVESDARRSVYTLTDRAVYGQIQQGHRAQEHGVLGQWRAKYPLRRRAGGWW